MGKSNFIVTSTGIMAALSNVSFKTIAGTAVQPGAATIATGRDAIFLATTMPAGTGGPLELMQDVDKNAAVGDDVVVFTIKEGAGVLTPVIGQVTGIEDERVEINAPYDTVDTGAPVIHLKSGKVIGVATIVATGYDAVNNVKYEPPILRCYAARVDNVKSWQNVDWRAFYAQDAAMKEAAALTADLQTLLQSLDGSSRASTKPLHRQVMRDNVEQLHQETSVAAYPGRHEKGEPVFPFHAQDGLPKRCRAPAAAGHL